MKINWITGPDTWAFRFICEHYSKALDKLEHVFNDRGDIDYVCSPTHLPKIKPDSKTILHIDSNRWYERVL